MEGSRQQGESGMKGDALHPLRLGLELDVWQ